ncbi:MAG: 23S rRNA (uracil(1939)-C(5))-methyltransferase RlmD [Gammaproteobacteria bacterium]
MSRKRQRREPYQVAIDNLSHEGRGVGRVNGKTVFVAGALPGEQVLARKTRGRKSFDEAIALEVEQPNSDRVEPQCPHYSICGGCSLQHLASDKQIEHKQAVLLELFQHHADASPAEVLAPVHATPWRYRRRARLGVKYVEKKGGVLVGFREKASPYIADIQHCEVLHESIGGQLLPLRALIESLSIKAKVPQLEVAVGDNTSAIIIRHLEPFSEQDIARLNDFQNSSSISLYLQPKGEDSVRPLNDETRSLSYTVEGLEFGFSPSNFVQVNHAINCQMIAAVKSYLRLEKSDNVLDLFCGLGNFTLPIAKAVNHIHGIEGDEALVNLAKDNARANSINNASFAKMDLSDEALLQNLELPKYNKLLLDPPRSGAEEILLSGNMDALNLVAYVSCNPVTLARDAKHLLKTHKFRLTKLGVMDMFPHTSHVESLAIFER